MASRSLDDLNPATRLRAQKMMHLAGLAGFNLLVYCTLRGEAEQAELYAQGRTKPGAIVTWAKPGQSLHQIGAALDLVPLRGGKCVWGRDGADGVLWQAVGAIGEQAGLEWAGRWPERKREYPHFQYKGE